MRVSLVLVTALAVSLFAAPAWTKGGGAHGSFSTSTPAHTPAAGVAHDSHGHIARNPHAKEEFRRSHPCPATGKKTARVRAGWSITSMH